MPKITNGGKTYTLFLRPGLKYSNGKPVKASDFTYAVERCFKINSGGSVFYTDIVGAEKFAETKQGGIPGIKTNDKTGEIVINLVTPRGTFSNELGLMFVAPVPAGTPNEDLSANPPPGTGPYMITKSQPGRGWEYERNPYWAKANSKAMPEYPTGHDRRRQGDGRPQRPDPGQRHRTGQVRLDAEPAAGQPLPGSRRANTKAPSSKPLPTISTYYFWMNTQKAPFNDLKVRQAVNYAVDPEALERIYSGADHRHPPDPAAEGMPGHEELELYPHDLAKAKEMIKEAQPVRPATSPSGRTPNRRTTKRANTTRACSRKSASTRS